jgi:hypothetical protein
MWSGKDLSISRKIEIWKDILWTICTWFLRNNWRHNFQKEYLILTCAFLWGKIIFNCYGKSLLKSWNYYFKEIVSQWVFLILFAVVTSWFRYWNKWQYCSSWPFIYMIYKVLCYYILWRAHEYEKTSVL